MKNNYLELYHSGTKGMKWGVRRYQNEDGSLTELGKQRYGVKSKNYQEARVSGDARAKALAKVNGYKVKDGEHKGTYTTMLSNKYTKDEINARIRKDAIKEYEDHRREVSEDFNNSENLIKETGNLIRNTSNMLPTNNGTVVKKDYSNITDEELRKRVNRLNLEEQYGRLSGDTKYVKSGSEKVREVMQTAGAVVGVVGSAVAIAASITGIAMSKQSRNVAKHSDISDEDELYHHGVKGMKWGHRKQPEQPIAQPKNRENGGEIDNIQNGKQISKTIERNIRMTLNPRYALRRVIGNGAKTSYYALSMKGDTNEQIAKKVQKIINSQADFVVADSSKILNGFSPATKSRIKRAVYLTLTGDVIGTAAATAVSEHNIKKSKQ